MESALVTNSPPRPINPFHPVFRLWALRDLIRQLTRREVAMRYRGTFLGMIWSFVTPLVMLTLYTFVYSVIFKARWTEPGRAPDDSRTYFALVLFAGLIPYSLFAEAVNRAPLLVLSSPNYVKKVVFPLEALSVVSTLSAAVHSLMSIAILLIGVMVFRHDISPTLWLLPLVYIPLILLTVGLSWFLASLGMYVRDASQAVVPVVQMAAFLAPIFFPLGAVPQSMRWVFYLNPLTTIVTGFRQTILWHQPLDWPAWGICTVFSALVAWLGYGWFEKTRLGFADVL